MRTVRVIPHAVTGVRGRSARRKAFYARLRAARILQRYVDSLAPARYPIEQAFLDVVMHGLGCIAVDSDGSVRRIDPGEVIPDREPAAQVVNSASCRLYYDEFTEESPP